jgi:thioredoxin-related protein
MTTVAVFAALVFALPVPAPPAERDPWLRDLEAAKEAARASDRALLIEFTGSDWCPPCIKLHREVFGVAGFQEAASRDYVLVVIDNPRDRSKLGEAEDRQSVALHERYAVNKWPTIYLTDAEGRPFARTEDYRPGGPTAYLEHLATFAGSRKAQREAFDAAADLEGVERARRLDLALRIGGAFVPTAPFEAEIDAIVAAGDTALAEYWQARRSADALEVELPKLGKAGQWEAVEARLEPLIDSESLDAAIRQKALFWRGTARARLGRAADAKSDFEAAAKLDPESEFGARAKQALAR